MKQTKKTKTYFRIHRIEDRACGERYIHLEYDFLVPHYDFTIADEEDERGLDLKLLCAVKWQGHHHDGASTWYGRRWCVGDFDEIGMAQSAVGLLARIHKEHEARNEYDQTPLSVLGVLVGTMKLSRVVYDPRTGQYPLATNVLPSEYEMWMMDYAKLGWDYNQGGLVMAVDEAQARRKLIEAGMRRSEFSCAETRLKVLTQWQAAGSPVMRCQRWSTAKIDLRSVEELLLSPKEEAERKQKAADAAARKEEVAA